MVIGSNERSRRLKVPIDISGQIQPLEIGQNWLKCPKVVIFQNMGIYEIVNPPFESGGGWGLSVFHKYFLVKFILHFLLR